MPTMQPDVTVGRDGWLFLSGGSNAPFELFSRPTRDLTRLANQWTALLRYRQDRAAEGGARYVHLFAPDKANTYREEIIRKRPRLKFPAEMIEAQTASGPLSECLAPLSGYFRKQAATMPMFYKTDTHWTVEGCFSAYQVLCWRIGVEQKADMIVRPRVRIEAKLLDLGGKLSPPISETVEYGQFGVGAERTFANDIVRLREEGVLANQIGLHVGSIVTFRNPSTKSPLRALVFGDSFCEYRTNQLTGMLAETLREVTFVWSASIDWNLVQDLKPDLIVTEIAERFMGRVPLDDLDIRSHAQNKVKSALASIANG